jgi:argininosuccinate synthase
MVDVAKDYGADAVAHGCTGKGNDQVSSHSYTCRGDFDINYYIYIYIYSLKT